MSRLSSSMKIRYYPFLIKRDGNKCFYCQDAFTIENPYEYDHLNNDENDSRPENTVLNHHPCNVKKKYSSLWQAKALGKLKMNEASKYVCERTSADSGTKNDTTSCSEINKTNKRIADQFILEHTMHGEELIEKDGVNAVVNICFENNGTGSQPAVYRYFEELSSPYNGKYTICSNSKGQNIIRRRTEN